MNALKVLIIVAALAIFGCAGVERECVQRAIDYHVKEVKYIRTFDYEYEDKRDLICDSADFSQVMIRSCLNR